MSHGMSCCCCPRASIFYPVYNQKAAGTIPAYDTIMGAVWEHAIFMFCIAVFIIYFNLLALIPRLLFKGKYLIYTVCVLAMAFLYYMGDYLHGNAVYKGFENYIDIPGITIKDIIDNILLPLVFLGATSGYKIFKKWIIDTQRLNELQKAQIQDELTHLKNQINPHFLFNTLNNLQTLTKTDLEKASQVILGLSDVLRFQIYDSTKESVLLQKDIDMLTYYLMLEKIRRDNFHYEIKINGDITGILIPPLLFINFIENALKHGVDTRGASFLFVEFWHTEKNKLIFIATNSKHPVSTIKPNGGLGLKIISRRLELLYGKHYHLDLIDEPDLYTVKLTLPI